MVVQFQMIEQSHYSIYGKRIVRKSFLPILA
jgi:hypothetical protein